MSAFGGSQDRSLTPFRVRFERKGGASGSCSSASSLDEERVPLGAWRRSRYPDPCGRRREFVTTFHRERNRDSIVPSDIEVHCPLAPVWANPPQCGGNALRRRSCALPAPGRVVTPSLNFVTRGNE
jgi:hypothetical protein